MKTVKNRLVILMGQKQVSTGEIVDLSRVSADTDIPYSTLARWEKQEVTRFDAAVITRLCKYFDCSVGELLELVDEAIPA